MCSRTVLLRPPFNIHRKLLCPRPIPNKLTISGQAFITTKMTWLHHSTARSAGNSRIAQSIDRCSPCAPPSLSDPMPALQAAPGTMAGAEMANCFACTIHMTIMAKTQVGEEDASVDNHNNSLGDRRSSQRDSCPQGALHQQVHPKMESSLRLNCMQRGSTTFAWAGSCPLLHVRSI